MIDSRKNTIINFLHTRTLEDEERNVDMDTRNKIINDLFNMNELESVLKNVNTKSAPGADDIPYSFFIHSPYSAKLFLLQFINKSWTTGRIPTSLKHSIIKPFLKPHKNKTDLNSYRPISLTSTTSKIMEKMIVNRLNWYLETNNLLNPNQAGFRKNLLPPTLSLG